MSKDVYETRILARAPIHEEMIRHQAVPSCLNCYDFDEKKELCQKYGQRPPPRVIVIGCPKWSPDIPF